MGLRILLIADPKIPVPPVYYGGAERIVALLADELRQRGHTVDLMAGPGSKSYGGNLIFHKLPTEAFLSRAWRKLWMQALTLRAARLVDVIINHGRLDYLEAVLRTKKPLIHVFHNTVQQSEVDWVLSRRRKHLALIGVSAFQTAGFKPDTLLDYIHNGTDMKLFDFRERPIDPPYLVFLGRITANKGADTAISVAQKTGLPLKLAGNVSDEPGDKEFFERLVKPQLGDTIDYIGPVNDTQKNTLLGGAQALLFPIRWAEPFGIVMAESLACGTPVISTRCASTPEIIKHGITGFLAETEEELIQSVTAVGSISRIRCREEAEKRFSVKSMTDSYLNIVDFLLKRNV